jgi:hypothetical protein
LLVSRVECRGRRGCHRVTVDERGNQPPVGVAGDRVWCGRGVNCAKASFPSQ